MVHIGSTPLDDVPRIALALRDTEDTDAIQSAVAAGVDVLEFRVDQFQENSLEHARKVLDAHAFAPRLLTIRCAAEGGSWRSSETERLAWFKALIPLAEAVDIELSAKSIRDEVIAAAHGAGIPAIGSFHDFSATPTTEDLEALCADAGSCGVDVLKVAATCREASDLRRLARFTLEKEPEPLIVVGMGSHGTVSRLFFPALGSRLTYTFLGEPTAPGQLNCEDMLKYRNTLYPA